MATGFDMGPIKRLHSFGSLERRLSNDVGAGYKVNLCKKPGECFICPLCDQLMKNPVQTYRGVTACAECYRCAKREDGRCPVDGERIDPEEIFVDKAKSREIMVLECYCAYQEDGCTWVGQVKHVEEHEDSCGYRTRKCRFCNEDVTNSLYTTTHIEDCEKWSENKRCLYAGCPYKPTNIQDLKSHLEGDVFAHAMIHTSAIESLQKDHFSQQQYLQGKCTDMASCVGELKHQIQMLVTYATDLQNQFDAKTNVLEARILQLESEKKNTGNNFTAIKTSISELNLRQQLFENTSHNGKLLWKIDNVSQRMEKAKNGSVTALHSAPVFTSQYGYKFCARLYLNGDGIGKQSHVSLFFVMMRGDYDNLLEWPFNQEVKFRLVNQKKISDDVIESFLPSPNSTSFIQPKKEMNIASGCPLFVKQEHLLDGGFIKDDVLFIELSVSDLPKPIA